ncbi:MAG: hypothetical protein H6617_01005 [Bdellovibrionaceae bacterium]|nr:hypothetical protein [Pseudobdellovibrionaceae bacterium]
MPKFVTTAIRNAVLVAMLLLLNACGDGTDTLKAKSSFIPDGVALDNMEKALPTDTGIGLLYKYKSDNVQVDSVSINPEIRADFPTTAKHHYALSTRYFQVLAFLRKIEAFLKEHEDFLKNKALKERYDKIVVLLKSELEEERQKFKDQKEPEYTEVQKNNFNTLDQRMAEATAKLASDHNVKFKVAKAAEAGKYEVTLNDSAEFTGNAMDIEDALEALLADCKTYKTLLTTVGDTALSNVLEAKIEAIEDYLP